MKFVPFCALLLLLGCADDNRYPVTGRECGPTDPVLTLDAADCTLPGAL